MFKFFKKLMRIVREYDADQNKIYTRVASAESYIRERTTVHADIHMKAPSQVILIGQYRGRDYVEIFPVQHDHFEHLLRSLRETARYATPGRIDAPWPEMRVVIDKELNY